MPLGAGLGGGSADGAFFLDLLNRKFVLGLSRNELLAMAGELGSDCAFFLSQKPVLARGRGDLFEELSVTLAQYYIALVYPGVHSSTALAYAGIIPSGEEGDLAQVISQPLSSWKNSLQNDFEPTVTGKFPVITRVKQQLYEAGALYAAMSGSGSTVFGIFAARPELEFPAGHQLHIMEPLKIL